MSFKILVVDDTKFMRKMLADILVQYGFEVVGEAENGKQAVQKYEELRPDIVLMDITMPEMDGIDAMKEIRRIDSTAVVLICSAMSQQDLISDALKAGANGYVMKPFKPNRVNEIIRKYGVPREIGQLLPQDKLAPEPVVTPMVSQQDLEKSLVQPVEEAVVDEPTLQVVSEELQEDSLQKMEELAEAMMQEEPEVDPEPELVVIEQEEQPQASDPDEELFQLLDKEIEAYQVTVEEQLVQETLDKAAEEAAAATENEIHIALQPLVPEPIHEEVQMQVQEPIQELVQEVVHEPVHEPVQQTMQHKEPVGMNKGGFKALDGGKIVNLFRGNVPMKNFSSSYMCNWSDEVNGEMSRYLVICTEAENKIEVEMTDGSGQKQVVSMTIDSFNQLVGWLQVQLGNAPVNVRELSKRADF